MNEVYEIPIKEFFNYIILEEIENRIKKLTEPVK